MGSDGNQAGGDPGTPAAAPGGGFPHWRWPVALLLLTAVAVAVVYYRIRETGFRWDAFAASFLRLRWSWVGVSVLLALATYYGRALRWAVMLKPLRPRPNLWNLFSATAIGFTAVVLLGRPGEFVRPYLIALKERVPLSSQLAAWLLERIYDLLAVLIVFGLALSQVHVPRASLGPGLQWALQVGGTVVATASFACLIVLFLLRQFSEPMRRRLLDGMGFLPAHYFHRAERVVTAFVEGLASTRSAASLGLIVAYTFLEWVLITACYRCLFQAYPETAGLTLGDVVVFMGFVSLGSVVQIPAVGGGIQIVAVLVLTELFGLSLELATSIALLLWIITFVVIVPFGLGLSFHEGLNWKRFRELEREAERAAANP
ncbi:MAG: lysylphosphatidylglycerol synthase transmembrane domain-containing protein [Acidobacteriota bacterium]